MKIQAKICRIKLLTNALSGDGGVIGNIDISDGSAYELDYDVKFHSQFDFSRGAVMPSNVAVTSFNIYMPLIKKCVTQWNQTNYTDGGYVSSANYIYYYNSDSTLFTGRLDPDDPGFYRVIYGFQKL